MRIINWNISYIGDTIHKIEFLKTLITSDCCVILQEVKPRAYEHIKSAFGDDWKIFYSLDFRKPGKYDSNARKLGVLIMISKDWTVNQAGVIERSPFPDRTLYISIHRDSKKIKVLALHSLTGCDYYKTKSVQFESFAEFVDEYCPDIVGMDANEPQVDHYDVSRMVFYDNKGSGASAFFNELVSVGLQDSYVAFNNIKHLEEGVPVVKSHNIRGKGAVRYDFVFTNGSYKIEKCCYYFDEAIEAGSDHAIIITDINN